MKLLLDTHIWLWYLLGDPRLSRSLQTTIADPNTELWLSPISIWETLMLAEKGRISLQPDPVTWVNLALKTLETREAQMNHPIAILSRQIALPHQDPADRFIVATAIYYGLNLATVDANLTNNSALQILS
ncbi:PIN domain-containing protein [Kamptonema sp. UHCC 0994]|uniref:type II toxin-antitoxin system VapC family toxin n=1 Tax=Kamptonema sp. UHCC 0994 TaxID=3031329 RepID=UPI0023B962B4|nr:PIN domain-containing protein [Kamptonema sp. UHCC 0994]MDF0553074.1 PIN domain-containing protein [Kamptonema sp. UHCC 0994]